MTEINFYQIDDVLAKSIAPLLIKILEEQKKALIFCSDNARLKEIDDALWTYGKYKFIPHATLADKIVQEFGVTRQPVFLINEEKNINEADYLILTCDASDAFIASFKRVFYFYESQNLDMVKSFAKKFNKVNAYKKADAKWVKDSFML